MDSQRKTFMLLPRFDYPVDGQIQLGTLLSLGKGKIPDPDMPLNDEETRIRPNSSEIKRQTFQNWNVELEESSSLTPGFEADLPIFSPIGGALGHNRSTFSRLAIKCDLVTERFTPTPQYLSEALKDSWVSDYCHKSVRPSVYLVSGRMLANNADIESTYAKSHGATVRVTSDASALGLPLCAGIGVEGSSTSSEYFGAHPQHAFILAYELTRLKLKRRTATVKEQIVYTRGALFDDSVTSIDDDGDSVLNLDTAWHIEVVDRSTEHDI